MPSAKSNPKPKPSRSARFPPQPPPGKPPEVVDPLWLIQAILGVLLAALVCAWLSVCLLVYQGEWQLILHPARSLGATPTSLGIPFEMVHFDAMATGQPRLSAWWIPASGGKYSSLTVLYLHGGSGSLSDTLPALDLLHREGLAIFALDYRGFGASDLSAHPTDASMSEDAESALRFLTSSRHILPGTILPYGSGLGGSLAARLAVSHPDLPAVVIENPDPDPGATALAASPSRWIPVSLLFHERFEIAGPLAAGHTPKLLIASGEMPPAQLRAVQRLFLKAGPPSYAVTTIRPAGSPDGTTGLQAALTRFLDQYLAPIAPLSAGKP